MILRCARIDPDRQLTWPESAQTQAQCGLELYCCYKSVTREVRAGLSGSEHARFWRENVPRARTSGPRNVRARHPPSKSVVTIGTRGTRETVATLAPPGLRHFRRFEVRRSHLDVDLACRRQIADPKPPITKVVGRSSHHLNHRLDRLSVLPGCHRFLLANSNGSPGHR